MRFFNRKNKITFNAYDDFIKAMQIDPIPASSAMPDWYKKLPRYVNHSDKPIKSLGAKDLKTCVPFRDAMISGYLVLLPADIEVTQSNTGDIDIFTNPSLQVGIVSKRGSVLENTNQGHGMPNPIGTSPVQFAWSPFWAIKTSHPNSVLITHPFNRYDLPFVTTSGIIDSDYFSGAGQVPFFIKEGFTGVIPKGTPIMQVLPYERKSWISEVGTLVMGEHNKLMSLRDSYLEGFYSRFARQKKEYK